MYLDVLREIGNIGAGNATSAIANMLGMKIDMNVPSIRLMEVSQLGMAVGAEDETIVGIFLEVETDIEGSMMFLLDIPSARYLVNKLMMTNEPDDQPFGEMELSALKEIGNIIAGSYLSALSSLTNLVITPSVPYIAVDMAASILSVPAIEFGQCIVDTDGDLCGCGDQRIFHLDAGAGFLRKNINVTWYLNIRRMRI